MNLKQDISDRRRQTRSEIYQFLFNNSKFCSKQSIAYDMGLSLPTVYQNLTELMDAGLVSFSGKQRSTGGRCAMGLDIVPDARIAIGISVTDSRVRLVAADLRLHELCYQSIHHPLDPESDKMTAFLAEALNAFVCDNQINSDNILGVGIAFPAVISADMESMLLAPTLHIQNANLVGLRNAIPYPVYVQNDGTCGGHAEWFLRTKNGTIDGSKNLAYISLENGVGGSLLLDGRLHAGDHFRSGEFGHMHIESNGRLCECGQHGCLEAYCSARRVSDELGITLDDFFRALAGGKKEYTDIWLDLLQHLAIGINILNMALDCEVVLGGFLSEYLGPWMDQLRQYVVEGNPFEKDGTFVHLSRLQSHNVPLGAALHFIKKFIDSI